jgi:hypothetical protein
MRKLPAIALATFVLVGCGSTTSDSSSGSTKKEEAGTESSISKGLGSADASGDVAEPECQPNDLGTASGSVEVTNTSSERSDYAITVVMESADGKKQIEATYGGVEALEPGQTGTAELSFSEAMPDGATCRVTEVQRIASA